MRIAQVRSGERWGDPCLIGSFSYVDGVYVTMAKIDGVFQWIWRGWWSVC